MTRTELAVTEAPIELNTVRTLYKAPVEELNLRIVGFGCCDDQNTPERIFINGTHPYKSTYGETQRLLSRPGSRPQQFPVLPLLGNGAYEE